MQQEPSADTHRPVVAPYLAASSSAHLTELKENGERCLHFHTALLIAMHGCVGRLFKALVQEMTLPLSSEACKIHGPSPDAMLARVSSSISLVPELPG